jgi:hypothetical protein
MHNHQPTSDLLDQQRARDARTALERRAWRKRFALMLAALLLAVALASVLAHLGAAAPRGRL